MSGAIGLELMAVDDCVFGDRDMRANLATIQPDAGIDDFLLRDEELFRSLQIDLWQGYNRTHSAGIVQRLCG